MQDTTEDAGTQHRVQSKRQRLVGGGGGIVQVEGVTFQERKRGAGVKDRCYDDNR